MLWLFKETDEYKKVSYQFWQADNHPELCYQLSFMWQKLAYIHNNPVNMQGWYIKLKNTFLAVQQITYLAGRLAK